MMGEILKRGKDHLNIRILLYFIILRKRVIILKKEHKRKVGRSLKIVMISSSWVHFILTIDWLVLMGLV